METRTLRILPVAFLCLTMNSFTVGCTSTSDEMVVPEAGSVPPPSLEEGETPDPAKIKRVKIN